MKATFWLALLLVFFFQGCSRSWFGPDGDIPYHYDDIEHFRAIDGTRLEIEFTAGSFYKHPVVVFWLEDTSGNFLQTLFISETIGTGVFRHGKADKGQWKPGAIQRPAALPVWGHSRGKENSYGNYLPEPEEPVADAYTGATPQNNFRLYVTTDKPLKEPVNLLMEINQPFDFNHYWTNNKFPDDAEYRTSAQPALVYQATITPGNTEQPAYLKPIGHAHHSGENGKIYPDLSTISTALEITKSVKVTVMP